MSDPNLYPTPILGTWSCTLPRDIDNMHRYLFFGGGGGGGGD